jgi:hypothetical protein
MIWLGFYGFALGAMTKGDSMYNNMPHCEDQRIGILIFFVGCCGLSTRSRCQLPADRIGEPIPGCSVVVGSHADDYGGESADPTMASIVGVQCFLARKALGWSLRDLARAAALASGTVRRFECGGTVRASTLEAIQPTLEEAGIIFIDASDGGPGAKLRR